MNENRPIAYAVLRLTVGVMFLAYGVGKFLGGLGTFVAFMETQFAGSPLPTIMVVPFAYVLPFVEVIVGTLLVLGLFNEIALVLAGLLLAALTFGSVMEPDPGTVAHNVGLALVVFALLWLAEYNTYSLDRVRRNTRQE